MRFKCGFSIKGEKRNNKKLNIVDNNFKKLTPIYRDTKLLIPQTKKTSNLK